MAEKKGSRSTKSAKMIKAEIEFAKKQYEKKIKIKPGETQAEWEKRTASLRVKHEEYINKSQHKLKNKGKVYVHKVDRQKRYNINKGIRIQIAARKNDFLQNTLLVLAWAELKYKMDRDMILFIINLYNRETFFTKEEITYLASVYGIKFRSFDKFIEDGILAKHIEGKRSDKPSETDVYVVTVKATIMCNKIYDCIIGKDSLTKLTEVTQRHKDLNNAADSIVRDIIDIKSGINE